MNCTQCGNPLKVGVRFCNKCGYEKPEEIAPLLKILIFLRNIPQKNWRIIIIVSGILTIYYGIIGGILGFLIWKPVDNNFAKKLLKISGVIWITWIIVIVTWIFGYEYYRKEQYLKQVEQQKIDDEIAGDADTPIPNEISSTPPRTNISTANGIYPQASQRLLTSSELSGLSKWNLKIMRNEIFARHGYIFKTEEMKNYFSKQNWYKPMYSDVTSMLSDIETKNVELVKKYE